MTRLGVITQARMTSTRLPGKVLIEAAGVTMLDHHLNRLQSAGLPVLVATTTNATDDPLIELAQRRGLPSWRGSEDDVLERFAGCIREHQLDTVVRVTSDCPLIDGDLIARAVADFDAAADPWLYVSNGIERTFPRGMDFEVFSAEALLDAADHATEQAHREHVTPYLYQNGSGRITISHVTRTPDASAYRVTLDTEDDLALIKVLFEEYDAANLSTDAIIDTLDAHPELVALNAHIEQKKLGK